LVPIEMEDRVKKAGLFTGFVILIIFTSFLFSGLENAATEMKHTQRNDEGFA
jgi:hypothetical protein